jgi:hypothetical protein
MTAKTKNECKTKDLCHYDSLTRTKFFHGMLLTDEHLRAEQMYHREALKRVNRYLWGAGIVCGLEVERTSGLCIKVHAGAALDCHGNLIEVCKSITLDLSDLCRKAYPDGCAPEKAEPITAYLVLRYREISADPQPVLTPDDECGPADDGTKCEASKYREGFCLEFRDTCPDCGPCREEEKEREPGLVPYLILLSRAQTGYTATQLKERRPPCTASPPCCDCHCEDGAVGLAKLVIDCVKNTVTVECDDCRHYVWSPRLLRWLVCKLFGNIDKLSTDKVPVPPASAFLRNPLQAAWDASDIALSSRRMTQLYQEFEALKARMAAVEKTQAPRGKPKQSE